MNNSIINSILTLCVTLASFSASAQNWALPHISVANVRTNPSHSSELSTQVLMGTPLRVHDRISDGWYFVEMPDGYWGYVIDNSLTVTDDEYMKKWRDAPRVIVVSDREVKAYSGEKDNVTVSDLVQGDIMEGSIKNGKRRTEVTLPDGRTAWVDTKDVMSLDKWSRQNPDASLVVSTAAAVMGTPYLWGGLSSKGMDCSGLTKMCYYRNGLILMRDASQQALTGTEVNENDLKKGDLLFFGNMVTRRVNHVGIYIGDGIFIESAGRVRLNRLDAVDNFFFARRILGGGESKGITKVINHPWYFNQEN